jgi:hypothetical protein
MIDGSSVGEQTLPLLLSEPPARRSQWAIGGLGRVAVGGQCKHTFGEGSLFQGGQVVVGDLLAAFVESPREWLRVSCRVEVVFGEGS